MSSPFLYSFGSYVQNPENKLFIVSICDKFNKRPKMTFPAIPTSTFFTYGENGNMYQDPSGMGMGPFSATQEYFASSITFPSISEPSFTNESILSGVPLNNVSFAGESIVAVNACLMNTEQHGLQMWILSSDGSFRECNADDQHQNDIFVQIIG